MKRRSLLKRVWPSNWLAPSLGLAVDLWLAARRASRAGGSRLQLASLSEVRAKGFLVFASTPLGAVALLWDEPHQRVLAVDPQCPHRGCIVQMASREQLLVCPCHQALFSLNGSWLGGRRRTASLRSYGVKVENGRVSVVG